MFTFALFHKCEGDLLGQTLEYLSRSSYAVERVLYCAGNEFGNISTYEFTGGG